MWRLHNENTFWKYACTKKKRYNIPWICKVRNKSGYYNNKVKTMVLNRLILLIRGWNVSGNLVFHVPIAVPVLRNKNWYRYRVSSIASFFGYRWPVPGIRYPKLEVSGIGITDLVQNIGRYPIPLFDTRRLFLINT